MMDPLVQSRATLANRVLRTHSTFAGFASCLVLIGNLLWSSMLGADDPPIIEDPRLLALVQRVQFGQYKLGEMLPSSELECLFYENAIADHVIYDKDGEIVFVFASLMSTMAQSKLFPHILAVSGGTWKRFSVSGVSEGWQFVDVSDDFKNIVAVTDHVVESGGWQLSFVISNDNGSSWYYGDKIRKYLYFNGLSYFAMDESGSGIAIEYNDGDVGGYEQVGYFVSRTANWGETWSDYEFHQEYDTNNLMYAVPMIHAIRLNKVRVREIGLPGYRGCDRNQTDEKP